MHLNKPDFFIVGAPKCGTTALYTYLAGHPDIGMSKDKEPGFFASDIEGHQRRSITLAQYLSNFDHASGKHRIGEASTGYLASRGAPQEIHDFNPSAQIIVMLRNPIDVLQAWHSQRVFSGVEHIRKFEIAVDSQETRRWQFGPFRGEPVLRSSYREITRFSEHIQRYFDVFGKERVHIIRFDDFVKTPAIEYEKVLSFLGLRTDGRRNFEIVNRNKRVRFPVVQTWLRNLSKTRRQLEHSCPALVRGVRAIVERLNFVYESRPAMDAAFRRQLEMEYAPEIRALEKLLDRNLNHWLTAPSPSCFKPTSDTSSSAWTHSDVAQAATKDAQALTRSSPDNLVLPSVHCSSSRK